MAKKSKIAKDQKRREVVARYAARRAELKRTISDPRAAWADKRAAQQELQAQPRDASPVRVRNRDALDGRPRGHVRRFGLSRVNMRERAHRGELPGIRKASW